MISKLLVANRGEIAIRAFRAAYEMGIATVAVYAVRGPQLAAPAEGRRVLSDRRDGPPGPRLPVGRRDHPRRQAGGCRRGLPGIRLPVGEPGTGGRVRRGGHHVRRPRCGRAGADGQQGPRDRGGARAPVCRCWRRRRRRRRSTNSSPRRRAWSSRCSSRRCPAAVAAACGGSTDPDALAEAIEAASREAESAFGDPTVYLEQAVLNPRHIEVQILADSAGQRDPPLRARLQRAAPPSEGDRAGARPEPARGAAGPDVCRRGRVRAADRLHVCGHRRVPARRARPSRLHRDEPADPGRAHRHRGDHRRRPGRQPAAHRRGGDARPTSG